MWDALSETMRGVTGEADPLAEAVVLGDTGYFSEEDLRAAKERKLEVLMPDQQFLSRGITGEEKRRAQRSKRFTAEDFVYDGKGNRWTCPENKRLEHPGHVQLNRNSGEKYQAKSKDCKSRERCIASRGGKRPKRTRYIVDKSDGENLCEEMKAKIDDPKHRVLYGRRMQIIEPCFTDIETCKGMDKFTLRGKIKVNIQWLMYCVVHNLGKCVPKRAELCGI